jgi:[acyl-carrier-protein] S-malonyltransferase
MAIAFVFPGQGSQSVGMLARLLAEPAAAAAFAEADDGAGLRAHGAGERTAPRNC